LGEGRKEKKKAPSFDNSFTSTMPLEQKKKMMKKKRKESAQ